MEKSSMIKLLCLGLLLYQICCQVAPVYGNSAKFSTDLASTFIPTTQTAALYNFVINPSALVTMSSLNHQRPFISISGM